MVVLAIVLPLVTTFISIHMFFFAVDRGYWYRAGMCLGLGILNFVAFITALTTAARLGII